jgi:hypothetical protein
MAKKASAKKDTPREGSSPGGVARPPTKSVPLLAASIALFGLWFVFLLVTALWK